MSVPMETTVSSDYTMDTSCKDSYKETDPDLVNLQKVNNFVRHLPYFEKIKKNAFDDLEALKKNITESLLLNELRPGFVSWTNRLIIFIHEYGLFFTKEDHIKFIKIYIDVMLTPNLDLPIVDLCLQVLTDLLKKFSKLSRKDLVIEWRPIYSLYLRMHNINDYSPILVPESIESSSFASFIPFARIYFDVTSTKEMLEEWRPLMCPFDVTMSQAAERYKLFLPTIIYEHEMEHGYKLWLPEFLNLWTAFNMRHFWETHLINLFARTATDTMGEFDWNPYIPYIFSNILRGFGLPFGGKDSVTLGIASATTTATTNNNLSQIFTYSTDEISILAGWIVAMIGGGGNNVQNRNICMDHIKKLFQALRSFYYPSNTGSWSASLFTFLQALPDRLIKRIKKERLDKKKWFDRSNTSYYITDDDITEFVNALKDVAFTAIFSKSNTSNAKKAFQYLTFLRGDLMLPPLIAKIYESFQSLTEPHRYTSMLGCLVKVSRELVTYNPKHETQTQLHLLPLLSAVLPGLDPNDANKTVLTLQFLSHVLGCVVICDCTPALNYRSDLTEYEKELCFETSKFEDFIHEFFNKLFNYIDNLTSDLQSDHSSASTSAHSQFFNNRSKDSEDVSQVFLIQTIKVIVRQSSKQILKVILAKVKKYINGNTYNIRAGRIVSVICGWLVQSGIQDTAFETFLDYAHQNLSKIRHSKNYEAILENERGDIEVSWNFQLLSEMTKAYGPTIAKHMDRINELISWFRPTVHKESINFIGFCFRNILASLSNIQPMNLASVNYSIIFEDEKEFFSNHLPIRDWACTGDIHNLNIDYFIPSATELALAVDFVDKELDKSTQLLSESIKTNESAMTNSTKEERNRELSFINFLLYGACRLLKRPSNQKYISNHIETSVKIGVDDFLDKGLGFEMANFNEPDNVYNKLSPKQRDILINKRQNITEFIIKLADILMEQQTTETILFVHIARTLLVSSITYGPFVNDFEKMWKAHSHNISTMKNGLLGKRNCLRDELITRIALQYKFRTFHIHTTLNELDLKIIEVLFKLSTNSNYAMVRKDAQSQLFSIVSHYPYSSLLLVPKLVTLLEKCDESLPEENRLTHDQLKGCLYLLKGNSMQESLMIKQNWSVISSLWPALFNCQHFEKPSIQDLLDKIFVKTNKDFDSFENRIQLSDAVIKQALEMKQPSFELSKRLENFNIRCSNETKMIHTLMNQLIKIARESQLLWKNQATSFGSILFLLNSCEVDKSLLTEECIQLYVDSLVHENISIRRISIDALCIILKMIKPKKQTKDYKIFDLINKETNNCINEQSKIAINQAKPGYREDNKWHLYDANFLNDCFETTGPKADEDVKRWENTNFVDKSYWGYYCWPSEIKINLNNRQCFGKGSTAVNEFQNVIHPIENRFRKDPEFFNSFIKYSTIEESKGHEKFDKKKFHLFKSLFRNFGTTEIINGLFDHLKRLVSDRDRETHECNHKLAAEIVAGLIRGSKYWPLNELKKMWTNLKVILDLAIDNVTTENIKLWSNSFSTCFEDQDPRRMTFYLKYFTELAVKIFGSNQEKMIDDANSTSSFQQSSCLQLLSSLNQLEWRVPAFWSNLFDLFLNNMSHPYKAIREKNSLCISLCLINHIDYSRSNDGPQIELHVNLKKIVSFLEAKLNKAIELFAIVNEDTMDGNTAETPTTYNTEEHLMAINILQSVFSWFGYYMMKSFQPINSEILRLVPQICSVDKIAAQEVSLKNQLPIIRMFMSVWILDANFSNLLMDQLENVITYKSWHSRMAAIQMCQNFGIFNLFQVDESTRNRIKKIIMDSLCDGQLEVRLSACITLTGFIHSNFISPNEELINHLKVLSKSQARKKDKATGKIIVNMPNLIKRHGGILGLCAIVGSCPYDVPSYLPEAVTYLCQFTNDPVPIQASVRKCLSEFRRTHYDNWQEHAQSFDENQLSVLSDILISPNYYA